MAMQHAPMMRWSETTLVLLVLACTEVKPVAHAAAQPAGQATATPVNTVSPPPTTPLLSLEPFCSDTSETVALRCAEGSVTRRGDTLAFTTSRASRVNNDVDGEGFMSFQYYGRLRGPGSSTLHLLASHGYESGAVELLNDATGAHLMLAGYPVLSPDRARFAAAAAGYETCEGTTQLDVWRMTAGMPVREFTITPFDCTWDTGWWPDSLIWRSSDTLSFLRTSLPVDSTRRRRGEFDTARASLVRRAGVWTLDSVSAAHLPRQRVDTL